MFKGAGKIIRKEDFDPGLIGLFVNPYYFARKELIRNIRLFSNYIRGLTLDVGCGQKPYQRFFTNSTGYVGLEFEDGGSVKNKEVDYFYDGRVFPFDDERFDSVVAFEVLEHVFNPGEFLSEINRVLKAEGALLMSVSFIWDEHEQPFDYGRYTSFGLKFLLDKYGFEVVECRKALADIRVVFQIINAYLYKKIRTKNSYFNILAVLVFISPFNIMGQFLSRISPANNDLYLDNIVLAKKRKDL